MESHCTDEIGREGSPLPAVPANPRPRVCHGGAHGVTRPTCRTKESLSPIRVIREIRG